MTDSDLHSWVYQTGHLDGTFNKLWKCAKCGATVQCWKEPPTTYTFFNESGTQKMSCGDIVVHQVQNS